ncbi:methyltransferase domain-containing protein [Mesorhizobium sp. GbtcB19]|uniref:class I SAM-dependent methyltransferase n=1 Tax=Mesorhizobium sp. GbtcB19 TaxID=2824764 RepID=UPI001C2FEE72|nr:methyltransferase domain-containing protein [Mesorhizobium sp. GbtcB19]
MNPHRPSWLWTMWYRLRPSPDFIVPPKFNRNSHKISSLMPAEDSGAWLLERMRRQVGLRTLASSRLLDFGCGVRFTQAILNRKIPIGSYTGVDCFPPMIDFLRSGVRDRRFSFVFLDARHALYNPNGRPLTRETQLPLPLHAFDIVSLFSVITHQYPDDAASIFTMLRRHTAANGRLLFTCFLDDGIAEFEDRSPERNGGMCFYNPDFLARLVEGCGWRIVDRPPADPPLIAHSFICAPA